METVFEDYKRRVIKNTERITFSIKDSGLYVLALSARCKGEKQIGGTDDEDLRIEINGRKFAKLTNPKKYSGSPAAFSGGQLHNLKKTDYFILNLNSGRHTISLITDNYPTVAQFESLIISKHNLETGISIRLSPHIQAEDGNNYPWVTFVLVDLAVSSFSVSVNLKRRWSDHGDVKVIIDGSIERNYTSVRHKFWYFVANLLNSEQQTASFTPHLTTGLHYLELWADRMPLLNSANLTLEISTPDRIQKYKPNKFKYNYNKLNEFIINATDYWNDFFSNQTYPPPKILDPSLVKAILYRESRLGYYPDNKIIDVMQVWDPRNPSKDAILGKTSANEFINPKKIGHMKYSYPKSKIPPTVFTQENSIFWGIRWLCYKAQNLEEELTGKVKFPYIRIWRSWRDAVRAYNGNPDLIEEYIREVFSVYKDGVDLEGNILWEK